MRGSAVEEALALCETGEWDGIRQLREWNDGRLRITLERMLGDETLAAQALEAALDDIWRHAGAHRALGVNAEDWLFGRLRQVAHLYRSSSAPTHLRAVPKAVDPTLQVPQPAATPIETIQPLGEPDPDSPELVNSRLRRPSAPVQSRPIGRAPVPPARRRIRRRWLRVVLLWLVAGTLGFALALAGLLWLTHTSLFDGAVEQATPASSPAVGAPSTAEVPVPSPSARDLVGPPLRAPEPPSDVLAPETLASSAPVRPTPAPPRDAAVAPSARIVIHHGGDAESREVAQRLADQLRRANYGTVEIKVMPFEIGSASVRFFHTEDRLTAQQLVNALGPFLVWQGRAAPTAPIDFTDYRPPPSPGSLEIWLPRR
jgi:hypothetical protein